MKTLKQVKKSLEKTKAFLKASKDAQTDGICKSISDLCIETEALIDQKEKEEEATREAERREDDKVSILRDVKKSKASRTVITPKLIQKIRRITKRLPTIKINDPDNINLTKTTYDITWKDFHYLSNAFQYELEFTLDLGSALSALHESGADQSARPVLNGPYMVKDIRLTKPYDHDPDNIQLMVYIVPALEMSKVCRVKMNCDKWKKQIITERKKTKK